MTDARIGVRTSATIPYRRPEKQGIVFGPFDDVRQGVVPRRAVATRAHFPDSTSEGLPTPLPQPMRCGCELLWKIWTVVLLSSFAGFRLRARTSWRTPSDIGKSVSASRPVEGRIRSRDGPLHARCRLCDYARPARSWDGWGPVAVQGMPCLGPVEVFSPSCSCPVEGHQRVVRHAQADGQNGRRNGRGSEHPKACILCRQGY